MLNRRRRKLHGRIAVSKTAMSFAQHYVPGDYDIIPNGIDLGHFNTNVAPIEQFKDGKTNIVFVGRLEKRKGVQHLLKAYRQVKRDIPNSRLIIVGPGTRFRNKYEKQVARDCLQDVHFIGNVSYEDLPRYYQTADIFCAPATGQESFGIVLLEAMALGKPIVATSIEGYGSVLTHEREGLAVPPKNDKELARALTELLTDESMRREMGQRGLVTAQDYDWQKVARRVFDFYTRILHTAPQPSSCPPEYDDILPGYRDYGRSGAGP
jgi:phosphatidylinositol alpha-mannosyltransferase